MPLEDATHISDLVPDWPQGPSDPVSIGDDNLRMLKKVLQNDLPNINGPITGTPEQLNNLTSGLWYGAGEDLPGGYWYHQNPNDSTQEAFVASQAASIDQFNKHPDLAVTWQGVQQILYRVGSEFRSYTDNRNPADILGFGTWEAVTGLIAGVGSATDSQGCTQNYSLGYQAGYWRVQNGHIVAQELDVALTMDPVEDHSHHVTIYYLNTSAQKAYVGAGTSGSSSGTQDTQGAGGHTPTGTGKVTIGTGAATDGTAFFNPYYGCYIWKRTA